MVQTGRISEALCNFLNMEHINSEEADGQTEFLFEACGLDSYVSDTNCLVDMNAKNQGCSRKDEDAQTAFNKTNAHNRYVCLSVHLFETG